MQLHTFLRWVNPILLKRMGGLYTADLVDWWDNILVNVMTRIKGGFIGAKWNKWKAPSVRGNIYVIFVLYSFGITLAILIYGVEARRVIIKTVRRSRVILTRCWKCVVFTRPRKTITLECVARRVN